MKTPQLSAAAVACATLLLAGCASTSESAGASSLTANVGQYNPPPALSVRPRVGVAPFSVSGGNAKTEMNTMAADTMSTLMVASGRFNVIERTQLDALLNEQGLEGVVRPGELAATGEVRGVDYLLIGKVTNFRVKSTRKKRGFGLGRLANVVGGVDYTKEDVEVKTECGVDIRLVDPASGEIKAANFSDYNRVDSAAAVGVDILGANASSEADIQVKEDDYGLLLRLALDDALRKALPKIDQFLLSQNS